MNIRRRASAVTGAAVLAGGLALGVTAALPTAANATTCAGSTSVTGTLNSCTATGTAILNAGGLTMNGPASENWGTLTLNGQTQTAYDTTVADEGLVASDLRGLLSGSTSGWDITASATPFTGHSTGTVIPDSGNGQVLAFGGGSNATNAAIAPTAACYYGTGLCVAPATSMVVTYPAPVLTASGSVPAQRIYSAPVGSGAGVVQIGANSAANPGIWSITLPPTLAADTYTSTITLSIVAGP